MINLKQLENVFSLPGVERYKYFIKKVVDFETLYSLEDKNGFVTYKANDNYLVPFWPQREFAAYMLKDEFINCNSVCIDLDEFTNDIIPYLKGLNCGIVVFPNKTDQGVIISAEKLIEDIQDELEKY